MEIVTRFLIAILIILSFSLFVAVASNNPGEDYTKKKEVLSYIDLVSKKNNLDHADLMQLFKGVHTQHRVLKLMQSPAEAKPWEDYRKIFITERRIKKGVEFWKNNSEIFEEVENAYGVPKEILLAIIGVETSYGGNIGSFPVFDTLVTLGFGYEKRSKFFLSELTQLLLLAKNENLRIHQLKGSYAGAMGLGQFMPSSYRHYAIDFNKDGRRDLWKSYPDIIASVANYFKQHGWEEERPIALQIEVDDEDLSFQPFLKKGMKPTIDLSHFKSISSVSNILATNEEKVSFYEFKIGAEKQYWIGFNNFYVITRYNHSPLYAMAVLQLSREIGDAIKDSQPHVE